MDALILIAPRWDLEFHICIHASNMVVGDMRVQNLNGKCDQLISYAFHLFDHVERKYIIMEQYDLVMIYALHKFKHELLENKFVFYMAILYLIKKPYSDVITKWLLFFLESSFLIVYKPSQFHLVVDVISKLPYSIETLYASFFALLRKWKEIY